MKVTGLLRLCFICFNFFLLYDQTKRLIENLIQFNKKKKIYINVGKENWKDKYLKMKVFNVNI